MTKFVRWSALNDPSAFSTNAQLWCVCWFGDTEDHGWVQHKGEPVERNEAERRIAWGMKEYPHIFYWLEPDQ